MPFIIINLFPKLNNTNLTHIHLYLLFWLLLIYIIYKVEVIPILKINLYYISELGIMYNNYQKVPH